MKKNYTILPCCICLLAQSQENFIKIDRATFSMHIPVKWMEDTKDDMHDRNHFTMFEKSDSCMFVVVIGSKKAGAKPEDWLKEHRNGYVSKMANPKELKISKWGDHDGMGVEISGKIENGSYSKVTIFTMTKGDSVCIIVEFADNEDHIKHKADIELIKKSFVLKHA